MSRTYRRLLIVVVAGIAVIAAVSIYGDISKLRSRMEQFAWMAFVAALGLALCNYGIRYWRWSLYLRRARIDVPQRTSFLVFVSGFALSITPGKVGELIKSYLLRASDNVPVAQSAPVIVAERFTDLLALLLLGLAGCVMYGVGVATVAAGGALVAVGLVIVAWPRMGNAFIRLLTRPQKMRRFRNRLQEAYSGLAALLSPGPMIWATALATVAWLAECVGFALIVSGFAGTHVDLGLAILIYAVTTVAGALSFLPGGLLVTEAGMTLLLVETSRGVDQTTAAAATILTRLATLWFAVVLGLAALAILRRYSPATARADAEPEQAES